MKIKFIENTNKQYSITDLGEVIKNSTGLILKQNTTRKTPFIDISINNKNKRISPNLLLPEYFGVKKCLSCFEIKPSLSFTKNLNSCKECVNKKDHKRKMLKGQIKKASDKKVAEITKSYVANKILNIKVSQLTEEAFQETKKALLFKRRVVKEQNVNYQSLT